MAWPVTAFDRREIHTGTIFDRLIKSMSTHNETQKDVFVRSNQNDVRFPNRWCK